MKRSAFTLVELVIVVLIVGILAAVAAPKIFDVTKEANQSAFIRELLVFVDAAERFYEETGAFPEDYGSGRLGTDGFDAYVSEKEWTGGTPLGGVWDVEQSDFGVECAIGVHFFNVTAKSDEYMLELDAKFDDGDLRDGAFQKLGAARFYFIVQE